MLLAAYGVLTLPQLWWENDISEALLAAPVLSIYFFHALGVPGVLAHGGMCGWSWCEPTVLGWAFLIAFWFVLAWLTAWGIAALRRK